MAIRKFVLAKEGPKEDPSKKRIQQLDDQIKQTRELLKQAKESDPKSERVFNLQQRVNTLTTQKDRAKKRADDRVKDEKASLTYEVPAYIEGDDVVHMVSDSHARIKDGRWDGAAAMCGHPAPEENSGKKWVASYGGATCSACIRAYVAAGGQGWFLQMGSMEAHYVKSIDDAIELTKGAHFTNLAVRKDGQDMTAEADWIKKLRKL